MIIIRSRACTTIERSAKSAARRFAVCALLLLAAAACSRTSSGNAHVLRIADTSDPESLNPLLAHDQDTIGWDLLYCQTLVGLDAGNHLTPVLVTQIPTRANGGISADGRTITYHLRTDARFADGTPLTSADIAFTYRAILDPHNNVLSQDAYKRIASLETPDRHTVVIRLRKAWNAATSVLFAQADFAFGILPQHAFTNTDVSHASWGEHPFGTGPFRVVEWKRGDRIILERNPYFRPQPRLSRIVLQMIPSASTAFVALRTGEVDVAELTPDELQAARSDRLGVVRTPENSTVWFSLETRKAPTDDARVRRAIAGALDTAAMRKAYDDAYARAASFLPPVFETWYDASIAPPPHDIRGAERELDAAGWRLEHGVRTKAGVPLEGDLIVFAGRPVDARIATIAQAQLAEAGIRIAIRPFTTAQFNAPDGPLRNGRFMLAEDGWLGGADPEQSIVFSCAQVGVDGNDVSQYCDAQMDALVADQQTTRDLNRRRSDLTGIQRLVERDRPVIPLYYESWFDGVAPRVHGFARNMLRYPANVETWDAN